MAEPPLSKPVAGVIICTFRIEKMLEIISTKVNYLYIKFVSLPEFDHPLV